MDAPTRPKTRLDVTLRVARRGVHQLARLGAWTVAPRRWPRPELWSAAHHPDVPHRVAQARMAIGRRDPWADPRLEAGKRRNLALAAPAFDGLVLAPDQPLSFWRVLGRVSAARGYAPGMELRGGCVVPSVGGGLCLLSNALFDLAARAGLTVLERHAHSIEAVPPAPGTLFLDATVAWPHVDLVIAPVAGIMRLTARVEGDELVLALDAERPLTETIEISVEDERIELIAGEQRRRNRVVRRRIDPRGQLVAVEILGDNDRRILGTSELGRTCLSCGETGCADRSDLGEHLVALRPSRGA